MRCVFLSCIARCASGRQTSRVCGKGGEREIERDLPMRGVQCILGYTDLNSALSINYIVINVYVCMFCFFLICITSCLLWMWVVVVVVVVVALVASMRPHSLHHCVVAVAVAEAAVVVVAVATVWPGSSGGYC